MKYFKNFTQWRTTSVRLFIDKKHKTDHGEIQIGHFLNWNIRMPMHPSIFLIFTFLFTCQRYTSQWFQELTLTIKKCGCIMFGIQYSIVESYLNCTLTRTRGIWHLLGLIYKQQALSTIIENKHQLGDLGSFPRAALDETIP